MEKKDDLVKLSFSGLEKRLESLKKPNCEPSEMIEIFQTLGEICAKDDSSSRLVFEGANLFKFVSEVIKNHRNRSVKIHASAFLLVLSLSTGKFNDALNSEIVISLLVNLLHEVNFPEILDVAEAIECQVSDASHTPNSFESIAFLVRKLTTFLQSQKTAEITKIKIVSILSEILLGKSCRKIASSAQTADDSDNSCSGGGGGGSGSFSSSSSSSSSTSAVSIEYPFEFKQALANLYSVLVSPPKDSGAMFLVVYKGLAEKIKELFREEVGNVIEMEKKRTLNEERDIQVHYINSTTGAFFVDANKLDLTFLKNSWNTALFDYEFSEGIIKCEILVNFENGSKGTKYIIGAVAKTVMASAHGTYLGSLAQSFGFWMTGSGGKSSATFYTYNGGSESCFSGSAILNNSVVGIEIDMNEHTLCYFVNGVKLKQPAVNYVPSIFLLIGVGSSHPLTSYKFVSFRKLSRPTVSTVVPVYVKWV